MPRSRPPRACAGLQVCRPPAALPPEGDLCLGRDRSGTLQNGRLGGKSAALPEPLADALGAYVRAGAVLHADDTPVEVFSQDYGKASTDRVWVYARDERPRGSDAPPAAFYTFTWTRRGSVPPST